MARTKDFAAVIHAKLAADPDLADAVEQESFNTYIAMQVYQLRTEAGLTQKQLAERIGTQQSVVSRIEDADYDGHSLGLLKRIARALGKNLRVEFYGRSAPQAVQITDVSGSASIPSAATPPVLLKGEYVIRINQAKAPAVTKELVQAGMG